MGQNKKLLGVFTEDFLDQVRISETLAKHYLIENLSDMDKLTGFLKSNAGTPVVLDLNHPALDFEKLKQQINGNPELSRQLLGYFPHIHIQIKKQAEKLNIAEIFPRSEFFKDLEENIRRFYLVLTG